MLDEKHIAEMISLYKENKITKYVLERELSHLLGDDWEVRITSNAKATTTTTYGIFPMPEKRLNGLHVVCFIDECALESFYSAEELVERLQLIAPMKQTFIKSFFKLLVNHKNSALMFSDVIACFLRIYQSCIQYLSVPGKDFIPSNSTILELISSFENDEEVRKNIERLTINNIIPKDVIAAAETLVHDSAGISDEPTIAISDIPLPSVNLGRQEIRTFCDGTYELGHKDIPWDYTPSTNQ